LNLNILRPALHRAVDLPLRACAHLPFSANAYTVAAWAIGVGSALLFFVGQPLAGAAALLFRGFLDHVDGYIARRRGESSVMGGLLDDLGDRYILAVILLCAAFHAAPVFPWLPIVAAFGAAGALINAFMKTVTYLETGDAVRDHGKLVHPMDHVGWFGSAEFAVLFGIAGVVAQFTGSETPIAVAVVLSGLLAHVSMFQRLAYVRKNYSPRLVRTAVASSPLGGED